MPAWRMVVWQSAVVAAVFVIFPATASGQSIGTDPLVGAMPARPMMSRGEAQRLAAVLRSGMAEEQEVAYTKIARFVRHDPLGVKDYFIELWREALYDTKRFKEAASLGQSLINSMPEDTGLIMDLLPWRARGFLYEGGYERALFIAKGMYNVCPMDRTDEAVKLMIECLKDARRDDPGATERFQLEQVAGASTTEPGGLAAAAGRPTFLQSVRLPKALERTYEQALSRLTGTDYVALLGRGNLLLLADRPTDAIKAFQAAYQVVPEERLTEATESIARAIKAQDGGVGRASAWLQQQRAKSGGN